MHEHLKEHPEEAFMLFTKVYIYYNNTKTPWTKLTQKQKDSKGFKWTVAKLFCLSKKPLTKEALCEYMKTSPEFNDPAKSTNKKAESLTKNWKFSTEDFVIYGFHPVKAYDVKLLLNTMGIRMLHFVED